MKKTILLFPLILILMTSFTIATTQEWNSPYGDTWLRRALLGEEGIFDQGETSFSQQIIEESDKNYVICDFDNNISNGNEIVGISNTDKMIYVYSFNGDLMDFQLIIGDLISDNFACLTRGTDDTRYIGGLFEDDANGKNATFQIFKMVAQNIVLSGNATVGMNNVTCRDSIVVDLHRSTTGDDYFFQSCSDGLVNFFNFEGTRGYSTNLTTNCQAGFQWGDFDSDDNVEFCCGTMTNSNSYVVCRDAITDSIDYNETYTGSQMTWKFLPQRGNLPYDMITCHDENGHPNSVVMTSWSFYGKGTQWNHQTRTIEFGNTFANDYWVCLIEGIDYDNSGYLDIDAVFHWAEKPATRVNETGLMIVSDNGSITWEDEFFSSYQGAEGFAPIGYSNWHTTELFLWTGDFDGDGFDDDLIVRNEDTSMLIMRPGTLYTNVTVYNNFIHGDSNFYLNGVAIGDANGDSIWDLVVNEKMFISPYAANLPPTWSSTPPDIYSQFENPLCAGTTQVWTACQDGACASEGNHYSNDNAFDNERVCVDCETDGIIDSCGAYHNFYASANCTFSNTGSYVTTLYLNDQQNDDQSDWISMTTESVVWPVSTEGCVNTSTGFINSTEGSYNVTTPEEVAFQVNLDNAWGEIGLGTSLAKSLFWLVIMISIAVGILFHPMLAGNPMGVYAIGFIEIMMLMLGWKLGMIGTAVIVMVALVSLLLLVLMIGSKIVGGGD